MLFISMFKRMWVHSAGDRPLIIVFYILHILATTSELFYPFVFAGVINAVQKFEKDILLSEILYWLLIWVALFFAFNLFHRIGRYIEIRVAYRAKSRFIQNIYQNVSHLNVEWHSKNHTGDIANRINIASKALFDFTTMQFVYIQLVVMFWGSLIALYILVPMVSFGALFTGILVLFIIRFFDIRLARWYRVNNNVSHKISATLVDLFSNIMTIIVYKIQPYTGARLKSAIDEGYAPNMSAHGIVNAFKWFFITFLMMILQVAGVFVYIYSQVKAETTILVGSVTAVYQYIERFTNTFSAFAREYQKVIQWGIDMEAVKGLDNKIILATPSNHKIQDFKLLELRNLEFTRQGENRPAVRCSISFKAGEKIALVGESGSGKSTLLMLLAGLYQPDNVEVYVDGNHYDDGFAVVNSMSALIPQQPEVFEETILQNIYLGRNSDNSTIEHAVSSSTFDRVLTGLPDGLSTFMNEGGSNMSGGEKQRLALARGIFHSRDSQILLMDEPTSSIDAVNERAIYQNILKDQKDGIVVAAVHNISLTKMFDKIYVLEKGKVIDAGTYQELTESCSLFRNLVDHTNVNSK